MPGLICPSCSTSAPHGAIFCDNCGFDLRTVTPAFDSPIIPQMNQQDATSSASVCQRCGFNNTIDSQFCENCGTRLTANQQNAELQSDDIGQSLVKETSTQAEAFVEIIDDNLSSITPIDANHSSGINQSIPGKFNIKNSKIYIDIPKGVQSLVIGRDDPVGGIFPDINLDPYGAHEAGVGRRHIMLSLLDGELMIEDLESVNGSFLNREKLYPKKAQPLHNGDELRLGKLILIYQVD
jgi:hypothetical protein